MSQVDFQTLIHDYKKKVSSRYVSIDPGSFDRITPQEKYLVSRKYDGHFYGCVYADGECYLLNPKGTRIDDLPVVAAMKKHLDEQDIKTACLVGELYLGDLDRSKPFLVKKAITDKSEALHFAVFDIISHNDEVLLVNMYEKLPLLSRFVPVDGSFHLVNYEEVDSRKSIQELFEKELEAKQEGVIVKSAEFATYKVKPRYTFDAVVVGFAEGDGNRKGMVRDLLMAFRKEDGSYQVFAHLSHGFSDDQRRELLGTLSKKVVETNYIEVANNKVAFRMVDPTWIVEFSCLDVISDDSKGPIRKMNLSYSEDRGYTTNYKQQSVSVVIPTFVRFRDDKDNSIESIRFSQVEEVVNFDKDQEEQVSLPASKLLRREVFVKTSKDKRMVRKFITYKTNKESTGDYPAYVFHYTDFSPNRAAPLKREIKVSNSAEQIEEIYEAALKANVKSGWQAV